MLLQILSLPARAGLAVIAAMLALGIGLAVPPQALAQSAIRVLVNDDPITTYDIQNRARMLGLFSGGRQGEKEAMEQLVDERLMLQEAARVGATISDEELDEEFAKRATQANLNAEQFAQAFRQAGVDPQTFKSFLRANMVWGDIVRARVRSSVDVSETDVAAALAKRGDATEEEEQVAYEYMMQQILFVVPAKGGAGLEAQRRNDANAFRGAFQGCEASLAQAAGVAGAVVKPQVRREDNQLSGALKEAIASLEVGGITAPERVEEGFQLVAICAKKPIAGQTQATQSTERDLTNERGAMLARRYLRDLRSDAVIDYR